MLFSRRSSGSRLHGGPFGGLGPGSHACPAWNERQPCCGCSRFPVSGSSCLALLVLFSGVGLVSPKPQRGRLSWPSPAGAPESVQVSWGSVWLRISDSWGRGLNEPLRSWLPGCLGLCPSGSAVPKLLARKWLVCGHRRPWALALRPAACGA